MVLNIRRLPLFYSDTDCIPFVGHARTIMSLFYKKRNSISDSLSLDPSKHETLNQCWVDVGPPSATLVQHQPNISSMSRVYWDSCTVTPRG